MPIDLSKTSNLNALIAGLPNKITPKLFDRDLTGTGYSKLGYFNQSYHTINDLLSNDLLINGDDGLNNYLLQNYEEGIKLLSFPIDDNLEILHHSLSWLDFTKYANQFHHLGELHNRSVGQTYDIYEATQLETMLKYKKTKDHPMVNYRFSGTHYFLLMDKRVTKLSSVKIYRTTDDVDDEYHDLVKSHQYHQAILLGEDSMDFDKLSELLEYNDNNGHQYTTTINPLPNGYQATTMLDAAIKYVGNQNVASLLKSEALNLTTGIIADSKALLDSMAITASHGGYSVKPINTPNVYNVYTTQTDKDLYAEYLSEWSTEFADLTEYVNNYLTANDFTDLYLDLQTHQNTIKLAPSEFNHALTKSLRLLLAKSLNTLKVLNEQDLLYKFKPTNNDFIHYVKTSNQFSNQQKDLILTNQPLTVGTASAGSGKSHTLIGRLAYLKGEHENLKHALVLSFTNTAANNIKHRYPNVNSITLGNLFNQIYHTMYSNQELSASDTVINSLAFLHLQKNQQWKTDDDLENAKDVRNKLCHVLEAVNPMGYHRSNDPNQALSQLATLIANHLDTIITLLSMINQTTLELEPVIIYSLLMANRNISLPNEYQDIHYIITDESQDISTFEYILLITLTIKYRSQLMIMGDGAQTLYEFRSSNPQFLNAIESSGVFKSYKLTTNYRSNDAILRYANQFLDVIDANKYAHLKLAPNSLIPITLNDFRTNVKVQDLGLKATRGLDYTTELGNKLVKDAQFINWLRDKVTHHQQIAFMAYTRNETKMFNTVLKNIFSHDITKPKILDITPDRTKQATILSNTIRKCHHSLMALPLSTYATSVSNLIQDTIISNFRNKAKAFIPQYVTQALTQVFNSAQYHALLHDVYNQQVSKSKLVNFVVRKLIKFEIKYNAVYSLIQRETDEKSNQKARDNADILISTIHSAKGLEFDNTVVLFNEAKNSATSQASLRLYGVALTRAKQHEYIINVHHLSKSPSKKPRSITDNQSSMFETPMLTAQLRCENDLSKTNLTNPKN